VLTVFPTLPYGSAVLPPSAEVSSGLVLALGLLKPLGVFLGRLQENIPMLLCSCLGSLKNIFQHSSFFSLCLCEDCCRTRLHREERVVCAFLRVKWAYFQNSNIVAYVNFYYSATVCFSFNITCLVKYFELSLWLCRRKDQRSSMVKHWTLTPWTWTRFRWHPHKALTASGRTSGASCVKFELFTIKFEKVQKISRNNKVHKSSKKFEFFECQTLSLRMLLWIDHSVVYSSLSSISSILSQNRWLQCTLTKCRWLLHTQIS